MKLFKRVRKEKRNVEEVLDEEAINSLADINTLLKALIETDSINTEKTLNIATVLGCIELIANTVAMIPLKLYKEENGKVEEVIDDYRIKLLNDETGDTLNAFEFWKATIYDYFLDGNSYSYINKQRNKIVSIHHVEPKEVNVHKNIDPIFKSYDIWVNGEKYYPHNFFKLLRNSSDGAEGKGIIKTSPLLLSVVYNSLNYENILSKTGGNKKGFIESENKLVKDAIDKLKEQWRNMYSNNSENCVVLNKGLKFKESSATPTEMQINENKTSNAEEICKIFNVPPSIIGGDGKANKEDYEKFIKLAILPILHAIESASNRDLLLEKEKGSYFFAHDTKEVLKGDIEKRYKAYEIGIKNKILTINEARYEENKPPIEAFNNKVVLGLNDVIYDTETGEIYTPNTNKTTNINSLKGGEETNED